MQLSTRKTKRGEIEEEEQEENEEEGQEHCVAACQYANKIQCTCRCGGKNHGIKSMIKMDAFFEEEEKEQLVAVPVAVAPVAAVPAVSEMMMVRCDDCRRLVPEVEAKVWLAPCIC